MAISYVVSAKKTTAVFQAAVGNFTGEDELNLITGLLNRVDIQSVAREGLKPVVEVPVYGKVVNIKVFRPKSEKKDSIVILTEKHHVAVIAWDETEKKVITRAAGNVADRVGRQSDMGTILTVHSSGIIGIRIYEGVLKIVQWSDEKELKCYNVRFNEITIVDLAFLETNSDVFRIGYIMSDSNGRHLKIVELNPIDKELKNVSKQENIENEASMLIPVPPPCGGVIVLGQETILYKSNDNTHPSCVPTSSPLLNQTSFNCFCKLDKNGERFLLADDDGRLLMLLLELVETMDGPVSVNGMRLEYLGETSIAESITYLDNGVVYIGSRLGDSQLIRLLLTPNADGTFIQVLETYANIGPVRDMALVDCDGQPQLVTCSGAFKEGSLRIIRNGIGIDETATVDLPDAKGLFPLRFKATFDNYLVVSMSDESHILKITGEELEDVELLDVDTGAATLYAGSIFDPESGVIMQVSDKEIRLMLEGVDSVKWRPPNEMIIAKVAVNNIFGQVVICALNKVFYLQCSFGSEGQLSIEVVNTADMKNEIACIDMSNSSDECKEKSEFVVLGLWMSISAVMLKLPDLSLVLDFNLPTKILPRSIIATRIEDVNYLLVALGDGNLFYYVIDLPSVSLGEVKKASIGTRPPTLHRVTSQGKKHLFVCSDRPMIIYSSNRKLIFSNVNVKLVNTVCSLESSAYKDCLVLSDGRTMLFGTVDDIQKIHIRTIPLGENVRRIAYQKLSGTYCILTSRDEGKPRASASRTALSTTSSKIKSQRTDLVGADANTSETHCVLIVDQHTYQVLHCHELGSNEHALSVISASLGEDPKTYYIVGTAAVYADETESKAGRLLVFEVDVHDKAKMRKVHEKDIKGAPYSMDVISGKLICGINSAVRLFEWSADKELQLECSHFNNITALHVKTKGDQILVGDLMRSVGVLNYKSMEGTFEELAKDWRGLWMLAVEFITADVIIGAEVSSNLFTSEIDKSKSSSEDGRHRLNPTGFYYLGEAVNVFRRGSLVPKSVDSLLTCEHPLLFGTCEGSIGMIVQFPEKFKPFLEALQKSVADSQRNCLRIDHSTYRQFTMQKWSEPFTGFVDGDLIESVLDMPRQQAMKTLSKAVGTLEGVNDPSDVVKIVEDLARLH